MYRSLNSAKRFLRKRLKLSVSLLWSLDRSHLRTFESSNVVKFS
ncbi:hypothetical protein [Leptospira noguchii]|nr:hypothetical protein [Leptospira noguchii]